MASTNRMTEGSIASCMVRFALPLFFGNLFQQMYNTADALIVGNMLGNTALAAVSSTGSLVHLMIGFFEGFSAGGAGVIIARYFGAKDDEKTSRGVHTTLAFGIAAGLLLTLIGTTLTPQLLKIMNTPENVMVLSVKYLRTYFAGGLGLVLYNICRGIMQAVGDSKHPLYYLIISSLTNVALDFLLIGPLDMGVTGAALATIISQFLSVFLCIRRLTHTNEVYRVELRKIAFDKDILKGIISLGIPSSIANSIIAVANTVVQSNVNHFGEMAMAGIGAYNKIDGFAFLPITSFCMALSTFVSQNLGAKQYDRVRSGVRFGVVCSLLMAEMIGLTVCAFGPVFIRAFTSEPEAIACGVQKARIMGPFAFLLSMSHSFAAVMRGAGKGVVPMTVQIACWCVIRVIILSIVVPLTENIAILSWVYPITWSLSTISMLVYYKKADWMHSYKKV